ncbi:MAG: hypothetical protein AAGH79_09140 [Bacteroidota bacterium]
MNWRNKANRSWLFIFLVLSSSCATWHQRKIDKVSGRYRSLDANGVLYEINLHVDQTFMYMEVRGLVAESASGTWTIEGRKLELNTFEQPEDLVTYTLLGKEPLESDSLSLKILEAETREELFLAHCYLTKDSTAVWNTIADTNGICQFPLLPEATKLHVQYLGFFPVELNLSDLGPNAYLLSMYPAVPLPIYFTNEAGRWKKDGIDAPRVRQDNSNIKFHYERVVE